MSMTQKRAYQIANSKVDIIGTSRNWIVIHPWRHDNPYGPTTQSRSFWDWHEALHEARIQKILIAAALLEIEVDWFDLCESTYGVPTVVAISKLVREQGENHGRS